MVEFLGRPKLVVCSYLAVTVRQRGDRGRGTISLPLAHVLLEVPDGSRWWQQSERRERVGGEEELSQLVSGYRVSQAIYVVVKLGIPDLLADGPRDSDELANATGTHAGALSGSCVVLLAWDSLRRELRTS